MLSLPKKQSVFTSKTNHKSEIRLMTQGLRGSVSENCHDDSKDCVIG